jgi:hypothetical protein
MPTDRSLIAPNSHTDSNQDANNINPLHDDSSEDLHHHADSRRDASPKGVNCHQKAPTEAGARKHDVMARGFWNQTTLAIAGIRLS